jgi:hypothetical protein
VFCVDRFHKCQRGVLIGWDRHEAQFEDFCFEETQSACFQRFNGIVHDTKADGDAADQLVND